MRVHEQRLVVGDAVVAGAGREQIVKDHRAEHDVPARAAPVDEHPRAVDLTDLREMACAGDAVADVDDAHLPVEPAAVRATVAGAPTVVHIEVCESPAGPELHLGVEVG